MADADLPVFSIRPNWADGITEYLEWKTDIMQGLDGAEQRRALRITPRRLFEIVFNPFNNDRSFMDLFLHRMGDEEFLLPLWHDQASLTAALAQGGNRVSIDNTFREFETGGLAIIYGSTFSYEVVSIESQDDTGLDLAAPTAHAWPVGCKVYPLRVAIFDDTAITSAAKTSTVGDTTLLFRLNRANPYDAGDEDLTIYDGYPMLTVEPNRMDDLSMDYARLTSDYDNDFGLTLRRDETTRAFTTSFYNWQVVGREAHHKLRQLFYRMEGRLKGVWLPTFNADFTLARPLGAADTRVSIEEIGWAYTGGAVNGRTRAIILGSDFQHHPVRFNGLVAPLAEGEERLTLTAAAGFTATTGAYGSFMDTARLDQDRLEIKHHTDSDGVMEVSAALKTFANTRDPAGILLDPIPTSEQSAEPCGTPDSFKCMMLFQGWYYKIQVVFTNLTQTAIGGSNVFMNNNTLGLTIYGFQAEIVPYTSVTFTFDQPVFADADDLQSWSFGYQFPPGVYTGVGATIKVWKWDDVSGTYRTVTSFQPLGRFLRYVDFTTGS